jgi:flagellin-like protein
MRKGISPLISTVLLILITISATYIVINVAKPTVDRAYEASTMNEAEQNMQLLDNLIREVASEGTGSMRSISLKVSDGEYRIINTTGSFAGAIQFKFNLKYSPFSVPMFKKVRNLKYSAGMNAIGLVGYWKLDSGNGTIAEDSSGFENDGIIYNGSVSCANPPTNEAGCPEWIDGKFGNALSFDGVDDYVKIEDSQSLAIPGDYSVCIWFNFHEPPSAPQVIISRWDLDPKEYYIGYFPSGYVSHYRTTADGTHYYASWSIVPEIGKWYFVCGITRGNQIEIWGDGELKSASYWPGVSYVGASKLTIGMNSTDGQNFPGIIDEVRIYNRALNENEIKENFNAKASNYQVALEYGKIVLTGNLRLGKGTHKLCIEKIGELDNKPLIKVTAC